MSELPRYTMVIHWSDHERAFLVVTLPEWEGRVSNPVTHGDSYEEAVRNGLDAITATITSPRNHGQPLPPLRGSVPFSLAPV